jgi:hypothetical protein
VAPPVPGYPRVGWPVWAPPLCGWFRWVPSVCPGGPRGRVGAPRRRGCVDPTDGGAPPRGAGSRRCRSPVKNVRRAQHEAEFPDCGAPGELDPDSDVGRGEGAAKVFEESCGGQEETECIARNLAGARAYLAGLLRRSCHVEKTSATMSADQASAALGAPAAGGT